MVENNFFPKWNHSHFERGVTFLFSKKPASVGSHNTIFSIFSMCLIFFNISISKKNKDQRGWWWYCQGLVWGLPGGHLGEIGQSIYLSLWKGHRVLEFEIFDVSKLGAVKTSCGLRSWISIYVWLKLRSHEFHPEKSLFLFKVNQEKGLKLSIEEPTNLDGVQVQSDSWRVIETDIVCQPQSLCRLAHWAEGYFAWTQLNFPYPKPLVAYQKDHVYFQPCPSWLPTAPFTMDCCQHSPHFNQTYPDMHWYFQWCFNSWAVLQNGWVRMDEFWSLYSFW